MSVHVWKRICNRWCVMLTGEVTESVKVAAEIKKNRPEINSTSFTVDVIRSESQLSIITSQPLVYHQITNQIPLG